MIRYDDTMNDDDTKKPSCR